MNELHG